MNWWKNWKTKYWDKRIIDDLPGKEVGLGWCEHVPKLRQIYERIRNDVIAHRWVALSIAAVIIAALISR